MNSFKNSVAAVAAALAISAYAVVPTLAAPPTAASTNSTTVPIVGTVVGGGTFAGTLALTSFAVQNGQLVALGTLTGIVTTAAGAATSILTNIVLPVTVAQATCQILHLELGPLSLNLLGLQIDLSRIVLDITAQAGAGNLLGNLLCSVAGLLDNPGSLANLLNQILAAL